MQGKWYQSNRNNDGKQVGDQKQVKTTRNEKLASWAVTRQAAKGYNEQLGGEIREALAEGDQAVK